ncbi:MAG: hypothetical protein WAW75_01345 [Gallionella sp.]
MPRPGPAGRALSRRHPSRQGIARRDHHQTVPVSGRTGHESDAYPQADYLLELQEVARAVDAGAIAKQCTDSSTIAAAVQQARIKAIEELVEKQRSGSSTPC